jgi:3-hydroxyisobutyrate dehydrogenase-like beta-hydroxyacid dehydrogenase
MTQRTIGFIGLGSMGGAMAARLLGAGHAVALHDIDPLAMSPLAAQGALGCTSARQVGDAASLVFCCLPSPEISYGVAAELAASAGCRILVEMSTIGRPAMQEVQRRAGTGIEVLDCPISGGRKGALDGTLSAIVSGPAPLIDEVRPYLGRLASKVFVVGAVAGMAQVCKIANNAISISGMVVACEAVVMGVKAGLDPAVMIEAINASTGRNSATVDKFPRAILPRSFDYGGPITIGAKDLNLYLAEARAQGVSGLAVSNAAQLWSLAVEKFGAGADMTLFIRMLEEWAGIGADGKPLTNGSP